MLSKKFWPADVSIAEDSLFFFNSSFCFIIVRIRILGYHKNWPVWFPMSMAITWHSILRALGYIVVKVVIYDAFSLVLCGIIILGSRWHYLKSAPCNFIFRTLIFREDFTIIDSGSGSMFYHPTNHHPTTSILQVSEWKLDQKEGLTISRSIWLLNVT